MEIIEKKDNFDDLKIRVTLVDPNNWKPLDLIFDFDSTILLNFFIYNLFFVTKSYSLANFLFSLLPPLLTLLDIYLIK